MSPITQTPIPLSDEWATPKWLFDRFDAEFHFTIDACAKPWNAKHETYLDGWGLEANWEGATVWMNPPYSDIGAWMRKAYSESTKRAGATVVCLVPCTPDRHWWSDWVEGKAEVRYLTRSLLPSGRVHFEKEDGTSGRAPFPSCIVVFRPELTPTAARQLDKLTVAVT